MKEEKEWAALLRRVRMSRVEISAGDMLFCHVIMVVFVLSGNIAGYCFLSHP
jgi:hypothetical protein